MTQAATSHTTRGSRIHPGGQARDARVEPMAVCSVCGWRAEEPPGACATAGCGLKDGIDAHRADLRVRLGLPALSPDGKPRPLAPAKRVAAPAPCRKRPRPAIRHVPVCTPVEAPVPEEPPPGGVTLMDLGRRSCRWPLGDPLDPGFRYCGARSAKAGSPYCRHHRKLAWRSPGNGE